MARRAVTRGTRGQRRAGHGARLDGVLDDGTYDALVVEASEAEGGGVSIELTVVAGPAKGEVVTVVGHGLRGDPIDLLGVPGTLTVTDGTPSLRLEP
jgi:hypothetical protein